MMSHTAIGEASDWKSYFRDAAELLVTIERNISDCKFAKEKKGRINYVFDTNIVKLFLDPVHETKLVTIFSDESKAQHLAATATITAEFLFSRQLAGQRGAPAFLAPSHSEELSTMVHEIEKQLRENKYSTENRPSLTSSQSQRMRYLVEELRDGKIDYEHGFSELQRILPRAVMDLSQGPQYEAIQVLRLDKEDLLRPLTLDPIFTEDILNPPKSLVNQWIDRIGEQRKREQREGDPELRKVQPSHSPRESRSSSIEEKIERDAKALVQVLLLDEAVRGAIPPTRYVMVTADRNVYRAYSIWFWQKRDHTPDKYILRHPSQYVPVLNLEEMPNNFERSDLIQYARRALESLLSNVRDIDKNYPHVLSYYTSYQYDKSRHTRDKEKASFFASLQKLFDDNLYTLNGDPRELDDLKVKWHRAAENVVFLNMNLIRRRHRSEFTMLAEYLSSHRDAETALVQFNEKLLDELERVHMAFNVRGNITSMYINMHHSKDSFLEPGRGQLAIRTSFFDFTGDNFINKFLDELIVKADKEQLRDLDQRLRSSLDYKGMFFAACVAFRSGRWAAAWHYGNRALAMLNRKKACVNGTDEAIFDRNELLYFLTLVIYFSLKSLDDFRRAQTLLQETISYYTERGDSFGLIRSKSEFAALILLIVTKQSLSSNIPEDLRQLDSTAYFFQAVDLLRQARSLLDKKAHNTASLDNIILMQICTNIVSAAVYQRHLAFGNSAPGKQFVSSEEMLWAVGEMEIQFSLQTNIYPAVIHAEYWMLRWSLADSWEQQRNFKRYAQLCCENALSKSKQLIDFDREKLQRFLIIIGV